MSAKPSTSRKELLNLLERFNYSPASFDALRADCYEKQLAAHSLDSLELVYSLLLTPGQPVEAHIPNCPTWPKGTKRAGQLPGKNVLFEIKQRLNVEQTLNGLGQTAKFLEKLRSRATGLPAGQTEVLESVITMVGDELLQAKLGGSSIAANLPVVDRLLTAEMAKTTAKHNAAVINLRTRAEERQRSKLKLDVEKFQFDAAKAALATAKELKTISTSKLSDVDKIHQARLALFGELPAEPKAQT